MADDKKNPLLEEQRKVAMKENQSFGQPVADETFKGDMLSGVEGYKDLAKPMAARPTPEKPAFSTYDDFIGYMKQHSETPEDRQRRERRERSRMMVNSIADAGRALGNLYFTSQYAPNGYDQQKNSLTEAYQKRLDKMNAERDKNRDYIFRYATQMAALKKADRAANYQDQVMDWRRRNLDLSEQRLQNAKDETERKAAKDELQYDLNKFKAENDRWYKEGLISLKEHQQNIDRYKAATSRMNAVTNATRAGGYTEHTEYEVDDMGKKTGQTKTRTPNGAGAQTVKPKKADGGGTSAGSGSKQKTPSMLQNNNNSKTPSMLQ